MLNKEGDEQSVECGWPMGGFGKHKGNSSVEERFSVSPISDEEVRTSTQILCHPVSVLLQDCFRFALNIN